MDKMMFLGKEYSFPHELYEYILYCRKFQDDREQLLLLVLNRTQEKVYSFPDTEVEDLLREACLHTISYLGEAGIYNITEDDLVSSNSAFGKFKELQANAAKKMAEIGKLSEKEFKEGFDRAAASAASQVTGSGYSLISSSIIAHMAFAAMESSTIQSQEAKARRSLQAAVVALQNQTIADKKQREWAYVCVEVYPAYMQLIEDFFLQLINRYLFVLEQNHIFSYSAVNKFSISRSSDLLKNLEFVGDKEKVLIEAFKSCPYNVSIYQKLVDMDLLDTETEKTLEFYEQKDALVSSITGSLKVICMLNGFMPKPENIQVYKNNLKWLSLLQNMEPDLVEEQCFPEIRKSVQTAFHDMESVLDISDIRTFNDQMRKANCQQVPEYVSKVALNCGADVYEAVCGDTFLMSVISGSRIKADSYSSYKDALTKALSEKERALYSKKKEEQDEEEKKKRSKNRNLKIVIGAAAAAIALYFGGTSAYRSYQKNDINKQCSQVNGSVLSLDTAQFAESEWIENAEESISTDITYNAEGDYYDWNRNISVTITLKDDYDSLEETEQDQVFASIRKQAYDVSSAALESAFPKYCKYFALGSDISSDDWEKLKKIYGNGVFLRGESKIFIGTENNMKRY